MTTINYIHKRVLHKDSCMDFVPALIMENGVGGQDNFSGSTGWDGSVFL